MPRTKVYEAVTERLEILDTEGRVDAALMPEIDPSRTRDLYRDMVLMRTFDTKALKLQRQGRMGTWPPIKGQEAIQAGVALAMGDNDWLIPAFREHGIMVLRGVPLHLVFAYWAGDERGSSYPEEVRCFPVAVPVGSQWQHGTGVGLSLKLRDEDAVAVTFGGDGSTSEGDFHEAVNCAGVFGTKTVFVIQNNQWAISVPLHRQTAAETLAQKAHAYGIPGIQVDGNDVFAVYAAATEAIERTRRGEGPSLIEAVTYRLGDHTTADDASRYRSEEELEEWEGRDPILRLRRYLVEQGLWDDDQETVLLEEAASWVDGQVKALEEMEPQAPEEIFTSMYAALPPHVVEQMQSLLEEVRS
ncbi:MAG: pyruvate dehydrogenase (acetyl-transferring) E1 component subunit alpha [Acidobacteria bacterium]|uniref:Pyruvate dehydrogenase E1 component subunit alpha n=1 Tax=Candidatus Sulfomarinibacter kjeldsenii TaxID=2885994 RepID=A0A8J6Y459_9BACT|nr:pyruvate dehydrogenase (acetyl-transferring) E1 component subunit alpha [Candidatus Sulfomarinibacter kjeldsenii]